MNNDPMLKWSQIAGLGRNKLIRSSYVWLIVVPIVAKATSTLENPIVLNGFGTGIEFSTELPFNWKLLYLAAVLSAFGNLLFTLRCPDINKFRGFGQFESSGLGVRYLRGLVRKRALKAKLSDEALSVLKEYHSGKEYSEDADMAVTRSELFTLFWDVYYRCSETAPVERAVCTALFYSAFALIFLVFAQNMVFVFNAI